MTPLDEAAERIDARARALGLDLTTGGEPTFTRASSDAPEWRTEPLGDDKRARAASLASAIARRFGGAVELAPGRKYAGEDAPRWLLRVAWPEAALAVTPDPGVVEVNLPPAATWRDLRAFTHAAYDAAGDAGLAAGRLLHSGRTVGSGGGAHVTLGGPTPQRSPFVVRPALLPALVAYVHAHPSLSYAFTGLSAGATSQAPRCDEGGPDRVRDLRIALSALAARGGALAVDEVRATLAPLMCDATGNTHRAEINVEKLAAGLVELRAVESPPSAEMLLAVATLWRAIVVRLAAAPYEQQIVDWGARLHDEWMLPSRLAEDLAEVQGDLAAHDLALPRDLFAPNLARRYPLLGTLAAPGVVAEVRQALEPWPVVGALATQEAAASRAIDSSTDRLEIRLSGPAAAGTMVVVGGRDVPARPLEDGARVGGVRYRAAAPPPGGLAPTIAPHAPLTLALVDRANGATLAAARYHPWHPADGDWDALPRDAEEASRRCEARFERRPADHARWRAAPTQEWTLDLLLATNAE